MTKPELIILMNYLTSLLRRSWHIALTLFKIMLPIMLILRILEMFGFSKAIGAALGPVMNIVGLPAEAGIVWAAALASGLYGGIGALVTLLPAMDLTVGQMSILASLMLFAHALPVEQAVVHKAGANFFATSLLRISAGVIFALLTHLTISYFDLLTTSAEPFWTPTGLTGQDWGAWLVATLKSMVFILVIIFILLIVLDGINYVGLDKLLARVLAPLHKLIRVPTRQAPLMSVGLLMGVSYGGGLIIESARDNPMSKRELFLMLGFLSIFHAIIEDTLLMFAFGANLWVIFVARGVFSVLLIAFIGRAIGWWQDGLRTKTSRQS